MSILRNSPARNSFHIWHRIAVHPTYHIFSAAVQFVHEQYGTENVFRRSRSFFLVLSRLLSVRPEAKWKFYLDIFPHEIYVYLRNRLIFTCAQVWCTAVFAVKSAKLQSDKLKIDFHCCFVRTTRPSRCTAKCTHNTHEILMDRLSCPLRNASNFSGSKRVTRKMLNA